MEVKTDQDDKVSQVLKNYSEMPFLRGHDHYLTLTIVPSLLAEKIILVKILMAMVNDEKGIEVIVVRLDMEVRSDKLLIG